MAVAEAAIKKPIPFDTKHLDKLMDDAGIDVLVATSKHNIQYLLGGYRFFFFDTMEAAGTTRYLPAIVYQKGKPENAAYVGCTMENFERELGKFWQPTLKLGTTGTKATMSEVVEHIAKLGPIRRIGVEFGIPAGGRRGGAAARGVERRTGRCGVPARAVAREEDAGGDRLPARSRRSASSIP